MKKILSALALVSLAFGTASADPKLTLQYRTQLDAYQTDTNTDMNNYFVQNKNNGAYDSASDTVKLVASDDIVTLELMINPDAISGPDSAYKNIGQLDGIINLGKWEFGMGFWKDGKANGTYRLGGDAYDWNGTIFETYKLGTIYGGQAKFADNLLNSAAAARTAAAYLAWGNQVGKAKVQLQGALFSSNWDSSDAANSDTGAGYGVKADVMWNNNWDHQLTIKSSVDTEAVISYYVQPYFIPKTQLTVGGSLLVQKTTVEQYSLEARVRYVDGPLSLSLLNNFSHSKTEAGFDGHVGAYKGNGSSRSSLTNSAVKSTYGLWNAFAAAYKINDTVRAYFSVLQQSGLNDYAKQGTELTIFPGVIFTAKGNTRVSTGLRFGFSNLGIKDDAEDGIAGVEVERSVEIPVIVRIRL